jgi:hypothetical protein
MCFVVLVACSGTVIRPLSVLLLGGVWAIRKIFECNKCTGYCIAESKRAVFGKCVNVTWEGGGAVLGLEAAGFYEGVKDYIWKDSVFVV